MPVTYGLDPDVGFVAKSTDVVASEVDTALKGILGESAGSNADGTIPLNTFAGQIKTLISSGIGEMWDLLQAIYASFNPASATGSALDAICGITGTVRESAFYSRVTATCTGTNGTTIAEGKAATVAGTGSRFSAIADGVITTLTSWTGTNGYTAGDRVTNSSRSYVCITSGTSAGSGGPTTTAADITDNTAHWRYLGEGAGAVDIIFQADVAGQIQAVDGALSVIATPVSGWSNVTNLAAATLGQLQQTDASLRVSREDELAAEGNATAKAILGAVLRVGLASDNPVTSCAVFYNDTNITDVDGVPAHSVEVMVMGGEDADVAQAIFDSIAAGVGTYGTSNETITDDADNDHTVYFSRPEEVPIYVSLTVEYDPKKFPPTGGDVAVQNALVTFGSSYPMGKDVRSSALVAAVFDSPQTTTEGSLPVAGVLDVQDLFISTSPTPTVPDTIILTRRQLATFEVANIDVTLLEGTP
jgi:uncharacterized phage protein gp47/JayE